MFDLRRTYGWALLLEAFFLWISYLVSNRAAAKTGWWFSEYFAAIACGMQNALCTSYSGAILRTTHLTGACTDIGISIGHEFRIRVYKPLRKRLMMAAVKLERRMKSYRQLEGGMEVTVVSPTAPEEEEPSILWRLKVLLPLLGGYLIGAIIATWTYSMIRNKALLIPALFIGIVGFLYAIWTTLLRIKNTVQAVIPEVELPVNVVMIRDNILRTVRRSPSNPVLSDPTPTTMAAAYSNGEKNVI